MRQTKALLCSGRQGLAEEFAVPYFCQWESMELAEAIVEGRATPDEDPRWEASGALTRQEYALWANHVCGMACLKMLLASVVGKVVPTLELARQSLAYGVYTVDPCGDIHGMIYAPFVRFVQDVYGVDSRIEVGRQAEDIPELLREGLFFIASVHPTIRWPDRTPPRKGGHLVLITRAAEGSLVFHNPSGHIPETQKDVMLSFEDFDRFFAGRGLLIMG